MSVPLLEGKTLNVDRRKVGISYSGGGPLLLIELGVAQAFVDLGIRPATIAGVSAGAIAATAHALDPVQGAGIKAAAKALEKVGDASLKLTIPQVSLHVVTGFWQLMSIGDNASIKDLLSDAFQELAGQPQLNCGYFGTGDRPKLLLGATDRVAGEPVWFGDTEDVSDALVASSAIPVVFPPKPMTVGTDNMTLIDGGVVNNQPLSVLALDDCGTIYAVAVGYDGARMEDPKSILDIAMQSITITIHQSSRLEQAYVQLRMDKSGDIHHIHPDIPFPVQGFNFDPQSIKDVMANACQETKNWIAEKQLMPPTEPIAAQPTDTPAGQ